MNDNLEVIILAAGLGTRMKSGTIKPGELVTPDDYFRAFYGMEDGYSYPKAMIRSVAMWYGQYDFVGNPNILTWLLGRPPTTLAQFIGQVWKKHSH